MSRASSLLGAIILVVAFSAPAFVGAQEDLRATIELAIRSDSRSQTLSDAEIRSLVDALYADAQSQGVTAEDITWRPVPTDAMPVCGFFCSLTNAFGLDGSNYTIPVMLGASSLLLIFILGAYLEYRHFRHLHPKHAEGVMPPAAAPPAPPFQ